MAEFHELLLSWLSVAQDWVWGPLMLLLLVGTGFYLTILLKGLQFRALPRAQTMGGYVLQPREAVWKHRFTQFESVVITPTGGGRWSPGVRNTALPRRAIDSVIAAPRWRTTCCLRWRATR